MDEKRITEKIRLIRQNKQITLKDLAKRTDLTEGYLSRIENAGSAPPISTLGRIAKALDIDISFLLAPNSSSDTENPRFVMVRKEKIKDGGFSAKPHKKTVHGYRYKPIASEKRGKNMQPYILIPDFEPGEVLQHDGEEFFYVLEGRIEFLYGTEKYILSKGDCVYFESHIPHNGRSIGDEKAKVLIMMHPYKRL